MNLKQALQMSRLHFLQKYLTCILLGDDDEDDDGDDDDDDGDDDDNDDSDLT